MRGGFALTMNGDTSVELQPWDGSEEDELVSSLQRLNGSDRYSLSLWRLPEGRPFDLVEPRKQRQEYMQTAGSFDGPMIAEVRELVDGSACQYAIGRASGGAEDEDAADVIVPWDGIETRVRPNEVLDGREVADLFLSYYRTGELPPSYARRLLEL